MLQCRNINRYTRYINRIALYGIVIFVAVACSTTKHIPDGRYLLNDATIDVDNSSISKSELEEYLIQTPNDNVMGLWIYNWSGADTAKWINRWIRKIGDEPVVYNAKSSSQSAEELSMAMKNKGYLNAEVSVSDTTYGKKARVTYHIKANEPYRIRDYTIDFNSMANPSLINFSLEMPIAFRM